MPWTTPGTAVAGDVLTAAFWNTQVRDNSQHLYDAAKRIGYTTATSNYTVNQLTVANASNVFGNSISFTADGTSSYQVQFYCARAAVPAAAAAYISVVLYDVTASAMSGVLAFPQVESAAAEMSVSIFARAWITPAAGTRTLNVRAIKANVANNGTLYNGNGGTDPVSSYFPMHLAVFGPPLT
jgi:hypothetical protein